MSSKLYRDRGLHSLAVVESLHFMVEKHYSRSDPLPTSDHFALPARFEGLLS